MVTPKVQHLTQFQFNLIVINFKKWENFNYKLLFPTYLNLTQIEVLISTVLLTFTLVSGMGRKIERNLENVFFSHQDSSEQ